MRQARQRRHAKRNRTGMRRDPVVGQAVPGRKLEHREIGREERQRARKRRHAPTVAADDQQARGRRMTLRRHGPRQIGAHQAFGTIGDAGHRQRPSRLKHLCGRACHAEQFFPTRHIA